MNFETLQELISNNDVDGLATFIQKNDLELVGGKIYTKDKVHARKKRDFYDQRQLIKKILLNS